MNCPECRHQVSEKAATCPGCGHPLKPEEAQPQEKIQHIFGFF